LHTAIDGAAILSCEEVIIMNRLLILLASIVLGTTYQREGAAAEPRIQFRTSIEVNDGALRSVAFTPDGEVVACCGDQCVQLFDSTTGDRLHRLEGHNGVVNFVAISPDGKLLASAGEDQTIRLCDVETCKLKGVLEQRIQVKKDPCTYLAFAPDSKTLASCSSAKSKNIWLWDVVAVQWEHMAATPHIQGCSCVTFSPDGKYVAVAGAANRAEQGRQVSLYEVNVGLRLLSSWDHDGAEFATCIAFSPDGTTLATAGFDNTIGLWDAKPGRERLRLTGPEDAKGIRAATFLPDGDEIVSVTFEETVQLWDVTTGTMVAAANGTDKGVRSMAVSKDGTTVATGGDDQVIKLWDLSRPDSASTVEDRN
jgi:WD40 repeat protein